MEFADFTRLVSTLPNPPLRPTLPATTLFLTSQQKIAQIDNIHTGNIKHAHYTELLQWRGT